MPGENLLTPSTIKLFGRRVTDMHFKYDPNTLVSGYNNLLQRQLADGSISLTISGVITANPTPPPQFLDTVSNVSPPTMFGLAPGMAVSASYPAPAGSPAGTPPIQVFDPDTVISLLGPNNSFTVYPPPINPMPPDAADVSITVLFDKTPRFARIYGFSFEGTYYGLPRPSIFLVHGKGTQVGNWAYPSTVEQSGVAAREWDFSGPTGFSPRNPAVPPLPSNLRDLWYWEYEKSDYSIRLDPEAGPFEQILLVAALRVGADMADRATPRSGASLAGASLAGASLSGASLSGASLSGASLAGASLSGASLRGR